MAEGWSSPGARHGGKVQDGVVCVLAGNPGVMTLDGTNTWLVHDPGSDQTLVIDPGPDDEANRGAVLAAADQHGLHIGGTLLTHRHPDHAAGARSFARLAGC